MAAPIVDRLPQPDDHADRHAVDGATDLVPTSLRRQATRRALAPEQWVPCASCGMEVRAGQLARHKDTQH